MSLLKEIHQAIPAHKHVSDWYIDLHNSVSMLTKHLSNARKNIKRTDISDEVVARLQTEIVKMQTIIGQMEDDIEELGKEAFAKWDKK